MKEAIDAGSIEPEVQGRKQLPLCMNQYRLMFGISRQPVLGQDVDVCPSQFKSAFEGGYGHIVVIVNDQMFQLQCYVEDDGQVKRVSISQLERALKLIVEHAKKSRQLPIGVMTADQRDSWSQAYVNLKQLGNNAMSLKIVDAALFCLSLDDYHFKDGDYTALYKNFAHGTPHGKVGYGRNRWFDKALSLVVLSDGTAGINGEHSPCDALIPSRLIDWLVENEPARDPAIACSPDVKQLVKPIEWTTNTQVESDIQHAVETANGIGENSDA